jgi:hypothetical protein
MRASLPQDLRPVLGDRRDVHGEEVVVRPRGLTPPSLD